MLVPKLDDDGNPVLDENGEPVMVEDGSGYKPDADAQAWHDEQVKGLKAAQAKALTQAKKAKEAKDAAEAERDQIKTELETIKASLGDDIHGIEGRLQKLKDFESGQLKDAAIDEQELIDRGRAGAERKYEPQLAAKDAQIATLQGRLDTAEKELHKYRYTGRLEQAVARSGVMPEYQDAANAMMERFFKESADGEMEGYVDGTLVVDDNGLALTPEEFAETELRKKYPAFFPKDTSLPNNTPGARHSETNPFADDTRNSTLQVKMIQSNPDKARKLIKAAGKDPAKWNLAA